MLKLCTPATQKQEVAQLELQAAREAAAAAAGEMVTMSAELRHMEAELAAKQVSPVLLPLTMLQMLDLPVPMSLCTAEWFLQVARPPARCRQQSADHSTCARVLVGSRRPVCYLSNGATAQRVLRSPLWACGLGSTTDL